MYCKSNNLFLKQDSTKKKKKICAQQVPIAPASDLTVDICGLDFFCLSPMDDRDSNWSAALYE